MRYVNPNHPAGTLHPQPEGPGNGGRTRSQRARDLAASFSESEKDPVFQAIWLGQKIAFGKVVVGTRSGSRVEKVA